MSFLVNFIFILMGVGFGVGIGWFLWRRDLTIPQEFHPTNNTASGSIATAELEEERDFLNAQFDLLLSKLNDEAKTSWRTSADGTLGNVHKLQAEKARLAGKIKEFVGKVDKDTRRHVSSLDEESLGVISPIREQLESEEKSRKDVQDSFDRLVGKLDPEIQADWEGLNEGSVGLSKSGDSESQWRSKFESLLSKVAPDFQEWRHLEAGSLTGPGNLIIPDDEALNTQDWARSEVSEGPSWLLESPGREPDNLKKIWGVGPVLEKTLNSIGIYYFSQLHQLTESEDIAWVSERIKTFPDRITRDQWVEQAGVLLEDPNAVMSKPH